MPTIIEDFRKTAETPQIHAIDTLVHLYREDREMHKNYIRVQEQIERGVSIAESEYRFQPYMLETELELFVDPLLPERDRYADRLLEIKRKATELFRRAVSVLNMGHLGFIQRNYERFVGEPLPQ